MIRKRSNFIRILVIVILILLLPINNANALQKFSLTQIFYKHWTPGLAFGHPGFIGIGNFSNSNRNEILLVSASRYHSDVIALIDFNDSHLNLLGSKDKDFSSVYNHLIANFKGDNKTEFFISESWVNAFGEQIGSKHSMYEFQDYSFNRTLIFYYYSPGLTIDMANYYNFDQQEDNELLFAAWEPISNSETVRIYELNDNTLALIANHSLTKELDVDFRNIVFTAAGNFISGNETQIITCSRWSEKTNPGLFRYSFEIYQYYSLNKTITHLSSFLLNIEGSNVLFNVGDIDSDGFDELVVYFDQTTIPKLIVYSIDQSPKIKYFYSHAESQNEVIKWKCENLLLADLDNNNYLDIVLAETLSNYETRFEGRYSIFEFNGKNLVKKLVQKISRPPTGSVIGNIDSYDNLEIISIFNFYDLEDYTTYGGLEIWTTGLENSKNLAFNNGRSFLYTFFIFSFIIVYLKHKMKSKKKIILL